MKKIIAVSALLSLLSASAVLKVSWAARKSPKSNLPEAVKNKDRVKFDAASGNLHIYREGDDEHFQTYVPATKLQDVEVAAAATHSTGAYAYSYEVRNGPGSRQDIRKFIVGYSRNLKTYDYLLYQDKGYKVYQNPYGTRRQEELLFASGWAFGWYSYISYFAWYAAIEGGEFEDVQLDTGKYPTSVSVQKDPHGIRIRPGKSMGGFWVTSEDPPGIVNYFIKGYAGSIAGSTYEWVLPLKPGEEDEFGNALQGMTVGPVPIPTEFVPQVFVSTLSFYTSRSLEEGWIEKKKVAEGFEQAIQKIQDALGRDDKTQARSLLKDFIASVEAEYEKKTILSEAYALLKFNAEYLLEQLEKQK